MKKLIVLALSTTMALGTMGPVYAASHDAPAKEFRWQVLGGAPFAQSRAEAMKNRERVFREMFRLSDSCVAEAMRVTEERGTAGRLVRGDRLSVMMSRNFDAHYNVVFDPQNTGMRGVEFSVTTEEWQVECDGTVIRVILPEVCFNWSLPGFEQHAEDCAYIQVQAHKGDHLMDGLFSKHGLPKSSCYKYKQPGSNEWLPLPDGCLDGGCDMTKFQSLLGLRLEQDGQAVVAQDGFVVYSVPVAFTETSDLRAVFCDTTAVEKAHSCGMGVKPQDYRESAKRPGVKVATIAADRGSAHVGELFFRWRNQCVDPGELVAMNE